MLGVICGGVFHEDDFLKNGRRHSYTAICPIFINTYLFMKAHKVKRTLLDIITNRNGQTARIFPSLLYEKFRQSCTKYIDSFLNLLLKMFDQAIHRSLMSHRAPSPISKLFLVAEQPLQPFLKTTTLILGGGGGGTLSHSFCAWLRICTSHI